jgi:hypothetical protein
VSSIQTAHVEDYRIPQLMGQLLMHIDESENRVVIQNILKKLLELMSAVSKLHRVDVLLTAVCKTIDSFVSEKKKIYSTHSTY